MRGAKRMIVVIVLALVGCQSSPAPSIAPPPSPTSWMLPLTPDLQGDEGFQPGTQEAQAMTAWAFQQTQHPITPTPTRQPTATPTLHATPLPTSTPQPLVADGGALPPRAIARLGSGYVNDVSVSPDGQQIAVATSTGFYVYSLPNFERIWRRYTLDLVDFVEWSPDGQGLLVGFIQFNWTDVVLWNTATQQRVQPLDGWSEGVWSPSGEMIAVGGAPSAVLNSNTGHYEFLPQTVLILDGATGLPIKTLQTGITPPFSDVPTEIHWTSNERYVIALARGEEIEAALCVWEVASGELVYVKDVSRWGSPYELNLAISPDGSRAALWTFESPYRLVLLSFSEEAQEQEIQEEGKILGISWSPNDPTLAVLTTEQLVLRSGDSGELLRSVSASGEGLAQRRHMVWSPDGTRVALTGRSQTVILDGVSFTSIHTLSHIGREPLQFAWIPGGSHAVIADSDTVTLWDIDTAFALNGITTTLTPFRIAWIGSGERLLIKGRYGLYYVWNSSTGEVSAILAAQIDDLAALFPEEGPAIEVMSGDARWQASISADDKYCADGPNGGCFYETVTLTTSDASTGNSVFQRVYQDVYVWGLAWSPNNTMLAVSIDRGPHGHGVLVLDPFTGEEQFMLEGHSQYVEDMAFSPQSDRLASVSGDGTVIIWSLNP